MITAETLVAREVHYCVSSLVSTLAQTTNYELPRKSSPNADANAAHYDLCAQAQDLCYGVEDCEEAATQEGWTFDASSEFWVHDDLDGLFGDARDVCETHNIEPYQREVFEHWIVSDWLADKLAEKGEKVDKDFAGLTVWARTTTGQGIASDWVIEQIVADLNREG